MADSMQEACQPEHATSSEANWKWGSADCPVNAWWTSYTTSLFLEASEKHLAKIWGQLNDPVIMFGMLCKIRGEEQTWLHKVLAFNFSLD